jgi:UDP-3-O-[3-hydroxymyristoyl] glucosamine N-acyltransferase
VGQGARIGAECTLHAGAVVERRCILGNRVVLHAGAVVGSDGFGYAYEQSAEPPAQAAADLPGAHLKVPQIGIARIEDDVEIGANSCVDRAAMGETVVGRGTKIDNLVQVAHNVRIGPLSIICGQAGIAGSARLGAGVLLGGQAGIIGHSSVGDGARIAAQAGVMNDVPAGETWSGAPALVRSRWLRQAAAERQLVERLKDLADLERRLRALEEELGRAK